MRKFVLISTTILVVTMFLFKDTAVGDSVSNTLGTWIPTLTVGGVGYGIGIFLSIDTYIKNKFGTSLTDNIITRLKSNRDEAKAILTNIFGAELANTMVEQGQGYFTDLAQDHKGEIMAQKERAILLAQRIKDGLFTGEELTKAQLLLNDVLNWLAENDSLNG